jgi:hypothetical protein
MVQTPSSPQDQNTPASSKLTPFLRALGISVLVLILWSVDKFAVAHLPPDSAWRYIVGAILISIGLATVISVTDRVNHKTS